MSANVAGLLADAARRHGPRPALLDEGARLHYADLDARSAAYAGLFLECGAGPGERVGIRLPNSVDYVAAYHGALRAGAIVVPLNPLLRAAEIATRLRDAEARWLLVEREPAGGLDGAVDVALLTPSLARTATPVSAVAERDGRDVAVLLYTSGTSNGPKGAALTHEALRANASFVAGPLLGLSPDDTVIGSPPLTHVLGMSAVMNAAIAAGACVALMPRFDAVRALELIATAGATVFVGVPTMCVTLLRAAESLSEAAGLRVAHVGGASLPPGVLEAFARRFGCPVLEGYGMTEIAGVVASHRLGMPCKPGAVGPPADGVDLRIVDASGADAARGSVGEVVIRSRALTRGYWRDRETSAPAVDGDGWFATGDLGRLDEDGYLFLVDRKKDVVIRGGYSVYPREVEEVILGHPAVREVAVVGVPDDTLGQEVAALVVPHDPERCTAEELRAYARERLAAYSYPRLVLLVEELPKGPTGKTLKRVIDVDALARQPR